MTQEAGKSKPANVTYWEYCPECGKSEIRNRDFLGVGSRQCSNCGQEWWLDVDYSDVVRKNITRLFDAAQQREQPWVRVEPGCEMPEERIRVMLFGPDKPFPVIGYLALQTWFNEANGMIMYREITHWKPLPPAPPKQ